MILCCPSLESLLGTLHDFLGLELNYQRSFQLITTVTVSTVKYIMPFLSRLVTSSIIPPTCQQNILLTGTATKNHRIVLGKLAHETVKLPSAIRLAIPASGPFRSKNKKRFQNMYTQAKPQVSLTPIGQGATLELYKPITLPCGTVVQSGRVPCP